MSCRIIIKKEVHLNYQVIHQKKHKQYRLLGGSFKLSGGKYYNPDKPLLIGKKHQRLK